MTVDRHWLSMDPAAPHHALQFYGANDRTLAANAGGYLAEGIKQGDGLLMIAAPGRLEAFRRRLRLEVPLADAAQTELVCLDAQTILTQVIVDGQPEWRRFERVLGRAIETVQSRTGHARLRVYGEMVDLLWKAGQAAAAVRMEEYWNTLLAASADCGLFCSYGIDIFSHDFEPATVGPLLRAHSHLLPVGEGLALAVNWAVEEVVGLGVEVLGQRREPEWAALPPTVATILWLKDQRPDAAAEVLRRARHYYDVE